MNNINNTDQIFNFKGIWDIDSKCGLEIFTKNKDSVVVVTELYKDNPGTSVTEAATLLVKQICDKFGLNPDNMIYIEHNPPTKSKLSFYDEEFFLVKFTFQNGTFINPTWRKLSDDEINKIFS